MKIVKSILYSALGAFLVSINTYSTVLADPVKIDRDLPGVLSLPSQNYFKEVIDSNRAAWLARPDQSAKGLHLVTTVCVTVDENGVGSYSLHKSSGDSKYDQDALDVCQKVKLNKPPYTWNPKTKVGVVFTSRMMNKQTPEKIRDKDFLDTVKTASSLRWAVTKLPAGLKGKELKTTISAQFDKDGKQTFHLMNKSTDPAYDTFVMDTFKNTFIPAPPNFWDNTSAIEIEFDSKKAGTKLK